MLTNSFNTYNVLNKLISKNIRCIYEPVNSLLDKLLSLTDIEVYQGSLNTDLSYDSYVTSNYLNHSSNRNNTSINYHLSDVILLNAPIMQNLKKEDKVLLRNNLIDCNKIIFHKSLVDSWSFLETKLYQINYGIPNIDIDFNQKTKSIVVLNLGNNDSLNQVYGILKQIFPDIEIIKDINNLDYFTIANKLSEYKICINDFSIIDTLVAARCGCFIVSSTYQYDEKIIGTFNANDLNQIIPVMHSVVNNYSNNLFRDQINYIDLQYSWNNFNNNLVSLFKNLKLETFKI